MSRPLIHQTKPTSQTDEQNTYLSKNQTDKEQQPTYKSLFSRATTNTAAANNAPTPPTSKVSFNFANIPISSPSRPIIQPKLTINTPNDKYEQEADHIAEQIMRMPAPTVQRKCTSCGKKIKEETLQRKPLVSQISPFIQRKCAACEKKEEENGVIQTKSTGSHAGIASPSLFSQIQHTRGKGEAMDAGTQAFMENRFGTDFSRVRIHTNHRAAEMSRGINARAFTLGRNVYFNNGEYRPSSVEGKRLLAHELVHTLQQSNHYIRRQEESTTTPSNENTPAARWIVEDSETPTTGQMTKSEFLSSLKTQVCSTVNQELEGTPYSSDNCPYIQRIFERQQNSSASFLEQLIHRYEPRTNTAQNAGALIQLILRRVRVAVNRWKQKGDLSDVPEDLSGLMTGLAAAASASNLSSTANRANTPPVLFKADIGGAQSPHSPLSVMQSLGKGRPIDSPVRSKMEGAFGTNFSEVEIHTDSQAASLSSQMNARAFAVGNHIAFGSGEYQPGSLIGDALVAHELAHVVQQDNAKISQSSSSAGYLDLENDADSTAINVMSALWGKGKGLKNRVKSSLKSGLRIQRCSQEKEAIVTKSPLETIKEKPSETSKRKVFINSYSPNLFKQKLAQIGILGEGSSQATNKKIAGKMHNVYEITVTTTNLTESWVITELNSFLPSDSETLIQGKNNEIIKKVDTLIEKFRKIHPNSFSEQQANNVLNIASDPNACIGTMNKCVETAFGNQTIEKGDLKDTAFGSIDELEKLGKLSNKKTVDATYTDNIIRIEDMSKLKFSNPIGEAMVSMIGKENGIHLFLLSIGNGYHSVTIIFYKNNSTIDIAWKDQNGNLFMKSPSEIDERIKAFLKSLSSSWVAKAYNKENGTTYKYQDDIPEGTKKEKARKANFGLSSFNNDIKKNFFGKLKP